MIKKFILTILIVIFIVIFGLVGYLIFEYSQMDRQWQMVFEHRLSNWLGEVTGYHKYKEQQLRKKIKKTLSNSFSTWNDLCEKKENCEGYPIGYETIIEDNISYYFPLDISRGIKSFYRKSNNPDYDFAEYSDDMKRIKRRVSFDIASFSNSITDKTRSRLSFSSGLGLQSVAKYFGIEFDKEVEIYSALDGVFWFEENLENAKKKLERSYHQSNKLESIVKLYEKDGKHDYDQNFWFVSYGSNQDGEPESGFRTLNFISKKPIYFGHRIHLQCVDKLCLVKEIDFQGDLKRFGVPRLGYTPTFVYLPKKHATTVYCENDSDISTCIPKNGLLDTAPQFLFKIKMLIDSFTTKPRNIDGYKGRKIGW